MAVSFTQIKNYAKQLQKLQNAAAKELAEFLDGVDVESEGVATRIALFMQQLVNKYGQPAAELAAQWLEICGEANGRFIGDLYLPNGFSSGLLPDEVENLISADISEDNPDWITQLDNLSDTLQSRIRGLVGKAAKDTIMENLAEMNNQGETASWQKSTRSRNRRGIPRYCSVPTGLTTCAFCIMQASRGTVFYGDDITWHNNCDCVIVPFTEARDIEGYDYDKYLDMYLAAKSLQSSEDKPADLQARIDALGEAGTYTKTRETLVCLRYLFPDQCSDAKAKLHEYEVVNFSVDKENVPKNFKPERVVDIIADLLAAVPKVAEYQKEDKIELYQLREVNILGENTFAAEHGYDGEVVKDVGGVFSYDRLRNYGIDINAGYVGSLSTEEIVSHEFGHYVDWLLMRNHVTDNIGETAQLALSSYVTKHDMATLNKRVAVQTVLGLSVSRYAAYAYEHYMNNDKRHAYAEPFAEMFRLWYAGNPGKSEVIDMFGEFLTADMERL